jgi:hypothetical protein
MMIGTSNNTWLLPISEITPEINVEESISKDNITATLDFSATTT